MTIPWSLICLDTFQLAGRGTVLLVESPITAPRARDEYLKALGPVKVDGHKVEILGIEAHPVNAPILRGERIGLLVASWPPEKPGVLAENDQVRHYGAAPGPVAGPLMGGMNDAGVVQEQAKAWLAVSLALSEVDPDWTSILGPISTGTECAVAAIRRMGVLQADARIGATIFSKGVPTRLVIARAISEHEWRQEPSPVDALALGRAIHHAALDKDKP